MNKLRYIIAIIFCCTGASVYSQSNHILWYDEAAQQFEQSLVLGNGQMGASVFGGIKTEKIYLNEATLWSGEPVDPYMNPDAYKYIPLIREALRNENYRQADSLNRFVQGAFSQSYAPMGTVLIDFHHDGDVEDYSRELNIHDAICRTDYRINDNTFSREYFVSYPQQLMVIKLECDKQEKLNFDLRFESLLAYEETTNGKLFIVNGYAPYHAEPSYRGDIPDAVLFDPDRGTRFTIMIEIVKTDGQIILTDSTIGIKNGSGALILVSAATSFNGFDKDPAKEGLDDHSLAKDNLKQASLLDYTTLKQNHLDDYQSFFNRVNLDFGATTAPDLPTDERLKRYSAEAEDKNLEILYFQFGRYLLISSSRTKNVPANLQGIWNPYLRPPWSSNYTMNINVEENYWLAENTNLSEMHQPLLGFIENLATTGAITAKTFYGVDQGWVACHNSDIWAMSNPVGDFGKGHPVWANWNMSGVWLSTHLWDRYLYSGDHQYLKDTAYPLMKGAADFCMAWMVEDTKGNLITSPSTSPENLYITDEGYTGATFYGATADLAMIRELFLDCIRASEILETDKEFRNTLEQAMADLYPYKIGKGGNLQEWYHDWQDQDPKHRHQSHLYGLYPGNHISPLATPVLANACRKTLEIKGDESTGWSKGWRINLWARLYDGEHAYDMYRELLHYVDPTGLEAQYSKGGGTYPNMLDAHPPFQIDGNFGGAAGVVEMLLQSSENEIILLAALPDVWASGEVTGLRSRGGFEVSLKWEDKKPTEIIITSLTGGQTTLIHQKKQIEVTVKPGETKRIYW